MPPLYTKTLSLTFPPSSLYIGKLAAFPAISHNATSIALTAAPYGLKEPNLLIFLITPSTFVGSSPINIGL